jgi:hypothetical protein
MRVLIDIGKNLSRFSSPEKCSKTFDAENLRAAEFDRTCHTNCTTEHVKTAEQELRGVLGTYPFSSLGSDECRQSPLSKVKNPEECPSLTSKVMFLHFVPFESCKVRFSAGEAPEASVFDLPRSAQCCDDSEIDSACARPLHELIVVNPVFCSWIRTQ